MSKYDYLIVGSGLFGATFAYFAHKQGKKCLVIDKRPQLGGNVYCENIEGINVHKYGAHIFHTSNKQVWDFVNSIVPFNRYTNSPVANFHDKLYNLPFNMNTFYEMWGAKTRNKGLQLAKGGWVTFVDADDRLHADALEYYNQQVCDGVDMLMAGYRKVNDGHTEDFVVETKMRCLDREQALTMMYRPIWFPYQGYLWNKCYRKSLIEAYHLHFDEKIFFNEDRLFVTQYICHVCGKIVYSSKVVYDYFVRKESAMASLSKGYNLKFITDIMGYGSMRKAIQAIHPSKELLQLADDGVLESYRNIVVYLIKHGYPPRKARAKLMWRYMRILGVRRLLHDILLPHFRR